VGFGFHGDFFDAALGGVKDVNFVVVTAGEPELLAVDADVAHVGATASRDDPGGFDFACGEVDDADAALALGRAIDFGDAAVGDVAGTVAAGVEAVSAAGLTWLTVNFAVEMNTPSAFMSAI
jgi:hypothetical protein